MWLLDTPEVSKFWFSHNWKLYLIIAIIQRLHLLLKHSIVVKSCIECFNSCTMPCNTAYPCTAINANEQLSSDNNFDTPTHDVFVFVFSNDLCFGIILQEEDWLIHNIHPKTKTQIRYVEKITTTMTQSLTSHHQHHHHQSPTIVPIQCIHKRKRRELK